MVPPPLLGHHELSDTHASVTVGAVDLVMSVVFAVHGDRYIPGSGLFFSVKGVGKLAMYLHEFHDTAGMLGGMLVHGHLLQHALPMHYIVFISKFSTNLLCSFSLLKKVLLVHPMYDLL